MWSQGHAAYRDLLHVEIQIERDQARDGEDVDHARRERLMFREQLRQSLNDNPADIGEILVLLLLILRAASGGMSAM